MTKPLLLLTATLFATLTVFTPAVAAADAAVAPAAPAASGGTLVVRLDGSFPLRPMGGLFFGGDGVFSGGRFRLRRGLVIRARGMLGSCFMNYSLGLRFRRRMHFGRLRGRGFFYYRLIAR